MSRRAERPRRFSNRRTTPGGAAALPLLVLLLASAALARSHARADAIGAEPVEAPVLIELFTSQGCSSCPPADRLLSELAESRADVVALSFHVDYWNYIGWTDPFSSSKWSDRQRQYAEALGSRQIYTPQLVVNGRRHAVGSDRRDVAAMLVAAAADDPGGRIDVSILEVTRTQVSVRLLTTLEAASARRKLSVWVALVEDGLETPVGKGENAHRTLRNDCVVRRLERVDRTRSASASHTAVFDLDPKWQRDRLSVAAFVQDPETLHVLAAATAALAM